MVPQTAARPRLPSSTHRINPLARAARTTIRTVLWLIGVAIAVSGFAAGPSAAQSPSGTPLPDTTDWLLATVDSVAVPAQIGTRDTLSVHLYGTVGPNGCFSLARIDSERTESRLTLRPLVVDATDEQRMCTMAVVPLDATYTAPPPFAAGPLQIVVPQANRADVTATVTVTAAPTGSG